MAAWIGRDPASARRRAARCRRPRQPAFPIGSAPFTTGCSISFARSSRTASRSRVSFTRTTSRARWCSGTRAASPCWPSVEAGVPLIEYSPAEIKMAVTGYGRAEKRQLQQMVQLLLGLDTPPSPHDAADALAVAICHAHAGRASTSRARARAPRSAQLAARQTAADAQAPGAVIAHLSGDASRETRSAARGRRRRRRVRGARAALDVLRRRRARRSEWPSASTRA